jgi:PRTRC genetic system protein A
MDPRDEALRRSCPTVAAPRFGPLPEMANGQRVIVAANGVFLQTRLDWLDCTMRIAEIGQSPPLPYGVVRERMDFAFGVIPMRLLDTFVGIGRAGLPNEVAGGLIYARTSGGLRLEVYETLQATPDGIDYRMPLLADDESIAIDLHTHGCAAAFWSSTDNGDDRGVKLAGVFGHLHRDKPSAAFRLAVNGHFKDLHHPWEAAAQNARSRRELEGPKWRAILRWLRLLRGGE